MKEEKPLTLGDLSVEETFKIDPLGDLFIKTIHWDKMFSFYTFATGGEPIKGSNSISVIRAENAASGNTSGFSWKKPQRGRNNNNKLSPKTLFD